MNSKGVIRLFGMMGGDKDTNHARGYILWPTARRDAVAPMSDAALDGFYHAPYYGECERGPFLKDSN